jgi:hypothetical protein
MDGGGLPPMIVDLVQQAHSAGPMVAVLAGADPMHAQQYAQMGELMPTGYASVATPSVMMLEPLAMLPAGAGVATAGAGAATVPASLPPSRQEPQVRAGPRGRSLSADHLPRQTWVLSGCTATAASTRQAMGPRLTHRPPCDMPPARLQRTIFISGLPADASPRELHNMLRFV